MEFVRLCVLALVCAFLCVSAQAQGHYQLKYSDLLQNCSFIHRDEFSLSAFQDLVKAQLEARVDGDNQCQAAYRSLNANLENMLKLVNEEVSAQDARKLYGEMYGEYLVSLETELALLDLSNSQQAARASVLQGQIDALRRGLLDNKYEMQLYSRTSQTTVLQQSQQQLFGNISSVVQSLSQMPTNCVGKIGGWQQIMPVLLNATSFIGMATGQLYLPAAAATVQVGTEVAMILSNAGVKKALTRLVAQRNNQILACTYQSITYQACELKRAAESVADTAKVEDIINNRYGVGDEGEYERFVRAQQMLPKIRQIMTKVGEMGSAVTLNLELIFRYFAAVRVRPYEIVIPPANSPDEVMARWLNDMSNRGIEIPDRDSQGTPLTIRQKYERTITTIENYKVTITTVIATIREKRSFKDLRDELILQSRNLSRELQFLNSFLVKFPNEKTELPVQYKSLFVATERMLSKIQKFIDVEQVDGETYEDFIKRVDTIGEDMFAEFSYGSVAQVTSQTVLMIPQIAFERFERPFRAVENYYLNRDIERREDPSHVSYATYMINRSVQIRVLNLYKNLSASGQAFRLEAFETTKNSFEHGFRKEIRKMIDESLENESPILGMVLKGKTSAHLCALFSDHLRRENPKLWRRCQSTHDSLPLYQVMRNYRRPIELKIDYQDPCFYNSYRREEFAQSLLFDRLLEYGFSNKRR